MRTAFDVVPPNIFGEHLAKPIRFRMFKEALREKV